MTCPPIAFRSNNFEPYCEPFLNILSNILNGIDSTRLFHKDAILLLPYPQAKNCDESDYRQVMLRRTVTVQKLSTTSATAQTSPAALQFSSSASTRTEAEHTAPLEDT